MKKNYVALALCGILSLSALTGCGGAKKSEIASNFEPIKADFTVGMVTDAGTIDDKSFNQGTWEGVLGSGLKSSYLKPAGTTEADYLKEIGNLYDAGFKFIVTPGFKFETSIFKAQDKYPDAKFVILDGAPHAGDYVNVIKDNTVSILFAEHEAGFTAGVAAALELKDAEIGFIGGMEIPAVQKFNWGFQQGVNYANENLGTAIKMNAENVIYQGSFDNVAAGQQLAAQMYDKGVKAIFTAAGGVGVGAITEAKERAKKGEDVWVIGVDVDQYADGIYDEANGKSAILTSAMKHIDQATYDMIKAEAEGKFPGGQQLVFDAKTNGVGIPATNPNLSEETTKKVNEVFEKIKSGEIVVAASGDGLIK